MKLNHFFMEDELLQTFKNRLKKQVQLLNNLNSSNYQQLAPKHIQNIKQIDKQFIHKYFVQCNCHFMYTRHGKCQNWSQKKLRLYPNAAIAKQVLNIMQNTKNITKNMLYFQKSILKIGVSPLLRAKQTACLLKPNQQKFEGTILPYLTQNSFWPAGTNFEAFFQVETQIKKASFLQNPLKYIALTASSIIFKNQNIFKQIKSQSQRCNSYLMNSSENKNKYLQNGVYNQKLGVYQFQTRSFTKQHKINQLLNLIANEDKQFNKIDYWLFGHQGNFSNFFSYCFGIQSGFQFCQTRSIYKLKGHKEETILFNPPYCFVVDQKDGTIKANLSLNGGSFSLLQ